MAFPNRPSLCFVVPGGFARHRHFFRPRGRDPAKWRNTLFICLQYARRFYGSKTLVLILMGIKLKIGNTGFRTPRMKPSGPRSPKRPSRREIVLAFLILCACVTLTYSNHFRNSFQFDDFYAIQQNAYIRDLSNIPLFFKDARTNDAIAGNQMYRPLLSVTFAIDYWLGKGLNPVAFHVTTFFWYLVQLGVMLLLFRKIFDAALPDPRNVWTALFATALYGLHPAMAETINYIMQRADLYSTLAVVAGLLIYIWAPEKRKYGLYLAPVVAGIFAKQPAAIFPVLLLAWIWLFEEENLKQAILQSVPAFIATGAVAFFVLTMNASTLDTGGSNFSYRISQPAVLFSYFRRFFLPLDLSADTDRQPYTTFTDPRVAGGFVFILLIAAAIVWCRKRREFRPIAFGLFWFLAANLPTSWIALAEIENDHRLFFPFVGLACGVCWALALWIYRLSPPRAVVAGVCAVVLAGAAYGAHARNEVWHTPESLWHDVTIKSPANGRGLMNYGLSQMALGRYRIALDYFERAAVFDPAYYPLEINLGIANGGLNRSAEAERHFLRALELVPSDARGRFYYGRWLNQTGRTVEAITYLKLAIAGNPDDVDARDLLMQVYANQGDSASLRELATETRLRFPSDSVADSWLRKGAESAPARTPSAATPEAFVNESLALFQAGKYRESIAASQEALKLRPDYAVAWNNITAAYNAVSDWDNAIAAGEKAVSLDPGNERARNNLAWARTHKTGNVKIDQKQ